MNHLYFVPFATETIKDYIMISSRLKNNCSVRQLILVLQNIRKLSYNFPMILNDFTSFPTIKWQLIWLHILWRPKTEMIIMIFNTIFKTMRVKIEWIDLEQPKNGLPPSSVCWIFEKESYWTEIKSLSRTA